MWAGGRAVAVYVVAGLFLLARSSPREDSPKGSAWKLGVLGCPKSLKIGCLISVRDAMILFWGCSGEHGP